MTHCLVLIIFMNCTYNILAANIWIVIQIRFNYYLLGRRVYVASKVNYVPIRNFEE